MRDDNAEAIKRLMQAKKEGRSTGSKEMRYDRNLKKFVLVEKTRSDALPVVTDEDLSAFGRGSPGFGWR
jgi:hypothetical protein